MTIDKLQAHYGFTRMPFGRDLAPAMLHRHGAHAEAVARIGWCVTEARPRRHHRRSRRRQDRRRSAPPSPASTPPGTPSSTSATPPSAPAASTTPSSPRSAASPGPQGHPDPSDRRRARRRARRTRPHPVLVVVDEAHLLDPDQLEGHPPAHQPRHGLRLPVRLPARRATHPAPADQARHRSPPSTNASRCATPCPA